MVNIQLFILILKSLHAVQPLSQLCLKKTSNSAFQLAILTELQVINHSANNILKIFPAEFDFFSS